MAEYKYQIQRAMSPFDDYLVSSRLCEHGQGVHLTAAKLDYKKFDGADGFAYSGSSPQWKFAYWTAFFAGLELSKALDSARRADEDEAPGGFEAVGTAMLDGIKDVFAYVWSRSSDLVGDNPDGIGEELPNSAIVAIYDAAGVWDREADPKINCTKIVLEALLSKKYVAESFSDGLFSYDFLCENALAADVRGRLNDMMRHAYEYRVTAFNPSPAPRQPILIYDPKTGLKLRDFAGKALGARPEEIYINSRF